MLTISLKLAIVIHDTISGSLKRNKSRCFFFGGGHTQGYSGINSGGSGNQIGCQGSNWVGCVQGKHCITAQVPKSKLSVLTIR